MANFVLTGPGTNFIGVGDASSFASKIVDVSPLLFNQLPAFIREDHPKFLAFLEAYYEWLESQSQALFESKTVLLNYDIDSSVDDFVQWFAKEFMVQIPDNILADKRLLLKHIKEFYRSRGSEKSYRLLFRILFDKDVDFYYPHVDILRASDGKWVIDKTMRVTAVSGNPFDLASMSIRGLASGAIGSIERVVKIQAGNYEVYELFFSPKSIKGTFLSGETVSSEDGSIIFTALPVITGITITDAGEDYEVGDIITFSDTSGTDAMAKVSRVGPAGNIRSIEILDPGANYSNAATATFPATSDTAAGTPVIAAIATYPGYYLNEDGHLSTTKFLQDSYYYQQFSYVVLLDESLNLYSEIVKKLLHPAGLIMFGGVRYIGFADLANRLASASGSAITQILIDYLLNLEMNQEGEGEELQQHYTTLIYNSQIREGSYGLGQSLRDIDVHKFGYLPSPDYPDENDLFVAPNEDYWLEFGNAQVEHFADILVEDVIDRPWLPTRICPDPYLVIRTLTGDLASSFAAISVTADFDPEEDQTGIISGRYQSVEDQRSLADDLDAASSGLRPYATRQDNLENLLKYSEQLDNAEWTKSECTITANAVANPVTGATTADKIVESATTGVARTVTSSALVRFIPGQQYEFTGWAKAAGRNYLRVEFDPTAKASAHATYNLSTNSVYAGSGLDEATVTVVEHSPGWVKFKVVFSPTANVLGTVKLYISNSRTTMTYNGDGTSGAYVWGLQVRDVRSTPGYVESTSLVNYRAMNGRKCLRFLGAEEFQCASILSDFITEDAQTCHIVFSADHVTTKQYLLADTNSKWGLYIEGGFLKFVVDDGTPSTVSRSIVAGVPYIAKILHDSGSIYLSINGETEATTVSGDVADLTGTVEVGRAGGLHPFSGTLARIITDEVVETPTEQSVILNLLQLQFGIS